MRQHPTGCMCLGWVGSLPYTRRGRRPVGQSLLRSEGSGFSQGLLQLGWVQARVSGSLPRCCALLCFSTTLAFLCKAVYVPGVSQGNDEQLALSVHSSAGTCRELGPLSSSRVFSGAEKTVSRCNAHTMLPSPVCRMVTWSLESHDEHTEGKFVHFQRGKTC